MKRKKTTESKKTTQERLTKLEAQNFNLSVLLSLYVEYNKDAKGFQRFVEERKAQVESKETKEN
tara:strand:- start:354 stop:545 length:192 start_codon:yes stop_codon:yes gene_type:complete